MYLHIRDLQHAWWLLILEHHPAIHSLPAYVIVSFSPQVISRVLPSITTILSSIRYLFELSLVQVVISFFVVTLYCCTFLIIFILSCNSPWFVEPLYYSRFCIKPNYTRISLSSLHYQEPLHFSNGNYFLVGTFYFLIYFFEKIR